MTGRLPECQSAIMLLRNSGMSVLLACFLLFGFTVEDERKGGSVKKQRKGGEVAEVRRNQTVVNEGKRKAATPNKNVKDARSRIHTLRLRHDFGCTSMGGICQFNRYICQGHYIKDKCAGVKTRQCCMSGSGAWTVLCASHHNNRVRGCDIFGCGAYNSNRASGLHKAVDVVCDDYGIINAPFSGFLAGPLVGSPGPEGTPSEGVKLFNSEHCVKIFNLRPYRYLGSVTQGAALGYLLPLQERFSGITSHMELQMCDGSDPSPFI